VNKKRPLPSSPQPPLLPLPTGLPEEPELLPEEPEVLPAEEESPAERSMPLLPEEEPPERSMPFLPAWQLWLPAGQPARQTPLTTEELLPPAEVSRPIPEEGRLEMVPVLEDGKLAPAMMKKWMRIRWSLILWTLCRREPSKHSFITLDSPLPL
jgi:hypothetical protein